MGNNAEDKEWQIDGKTVAKHRNAANFHFMQVFEAGHMVPMDKPAESLAMVNAFTTSVSCDFTCTRRCISNADSYNFLDFKIKYLHRLTVCVDGRLLDDDKDNIDNACRCNVNAKLYITIERSFPQIL